MVKGSGCIDVICTICLVRLSVAGAGLLAVLLVWDRGG